MLGSAQVCSDANAAAAQAVQGPERQVQVEDGGGKRREKQSDGTDEAPRYSHDTASPAVRQPADHRASKVNHRHCDGSDPGCGREKDGLFTSGPTNKSQQQQNVAIMEFDTHEQIALSRVEFEFRLLNHVSANRTNAAFECCAKSVKTPAIRSQLSVRPVNTATDRED